MEYISPLNMSTCQTYVIKNVKSKFRDSEDDMPVRDTILGDENVPTQLETCDEDKSDLSLSESDNERLRLKYIVNLQ